MLRVGPSLSVPDGRSVEEKLPCLDRSAEVPDEDAKRRVSVVRRTAFNRLVDREAPAFSHVRQHPPVVNFSLVISCIGFRLLSSSLLVSREFVSRTITLPIGQRSFAHSSFLSCDIATLALSLGGQSLRYIEVLGAILLFSLIYENGNAIIHWATSVLCDDSEHFGVWTSAL